MFWLLELWTVGVVYYVSCILLEFWMCGFLDLLNFGCFDCFVVLFVYLWIAGCLDLWSFEFLELCNFELVHRSVLGCLERRIV